LPLAIPPVITTVNISECQSK